MDQNKPELTLEESIKQVMQTLPPAIRDYLAQGTYTTVAKSLMTKYALRIDQGGVLERELMLLLMGIETPEEFTKALATDASLNQQAINGIVQDVNTQIFIPLRNEMMRGAAQPAKLEVPPSQQSRPVVAPNVSGPKFFHLENKLPPRPVQQPVASAPSVFATQPAMQPAVVAKPATLAQAIGNALNSKPKVVQQPSRAPFSNIAPLPPKFISPRSSVGENQISTEPRKMLEDHEEPHIEFKKAQTPPPVNLPGAMPPFPVPDVEVPTQPVQPKPVPPAPTTPATPTKSYSADPYREPIE